MILLIMAIFIIGLYFALYKPPYFIILYGLLASNSDACGIVNFLSSHFGQYANIMNILLILAFIISIIKIIRKNQKKYIKYIVIATVIMVFCIISTFVMSSLGVAKTMLQAVYITAVFAPIVPVIWFAYCDEYNTFNLFVKYLAMQIVLAFLIVYLPRMGVYLLNPICGSHYISDGYIYNNSVATTSNFFEMFINKYRFNGLGQFQNGNSMGFYGAVGVFVFANLIFSNKKTLNKIVYCVLIFLSLALWFNSGMRGAVIGLLIGCFVALLMKKNISSKIIMVFILPALLLFYAQDTDVMNFFVVDSNNVSVTSRELPRALGWQTFKDNPVFGVGAEYLFSHDSTVDLNPHELALRLAAKFGIIPGIGIILLLYLMPMYDFIKNKVNHTRSWAFIMCVICVSLTNSYTCVMLFWMLFSESIVNKKNNVSKSEEKDVKLCRKYLKIKL